MAAPKSYKIGCVRDEWNWKKMVASRFTFRLTSPIGTQNVNANNNKMVRQRIEGRKIVGTFISCPIFSRRFTECLSLTFLYGFISYLLAVAGHFRCFYDKMLAPLATRAARIPNKNISSAYRPFWVWRRFVCICACQVIRGDIKGVRMLPFVRLVVFCFLSFISIVGWRRVPKRRCDIIFCSLFLFFCPQYGLFTVEHNWLLTDDWWPH